MISKCCWKGILSGVLNLQDWFSQLDTSKCRAFPTNKRTPRYKSTCQKLSLPAADVMLVTYVGDLHWSWPSWWHSCTGIYTTASYSTIYETCSLPKHWEFQSFFLGRGEVWSKRPKVGFLSQGRLLRQVPMCLAPPRHVLVNGCMCRRLSLSKPQVGDLVLTSCETGVAVGQVSDCHYATTTAGCPVWALSCWLLFSKKQSTEAGGSGSSACLRLPMTNCCFNF